MTQALLEKADASATQEALRRLFDKACQEAGFTAVDWNKLLAWAEKYGASLFLPAVIDVIGGNWAALWALALAQGGTALVELLAALGVTTAPVVTP